VNGHAKCKSKLAGTRCLEFGVAIKLNKKKSNYKAKSVSDNMLSEHLLRKTVLNL